MGGIWIGWLKSIVGADGLEIRYNDQTNDQRNENAGKWRSTVDMLEQIVAVMDVENEEAEARGEGGQASSIRR